MSSKARKRVNAACRIRANAAAKGPTAEEAALYIDAMFSRLPVPRQFAAEMEEIRFESKHWVEDIEGNERPYIVHACEGCGRGFMGHNERRLCRLCAPADATAEKGEQRA